MHGSQTPGRVPGLFRITRDALNSCLYSPLTNHCQGWVRYCVATVIVIVVTGLRVALNPVLGTSTPLLPLIPAVLFAAFVAGRGPALFASVLAPLLLVRELALGGETIYWPPWIAHILFFIGIAAAMTFVVHALQRAHHQQALLLEEARSSQRLAAAQEAPRKRIEQQLIEAQDRLSLALRAGRSGIFEWDIQTNVTLWSDELLHLYGFRRGEFEETHEGWLACVAKEDRERIAASARAALAVGHNHVQFRIRRHDTGELRWIEARGRIFYSQAGEPRRMVGINIDITEYKQATEALRESERRLKLIYDSSSDGLALLQMAPDQRIQVASVNATLLRATGLLREQVEGHFLHEILSEQHHELVIGKCRDALRTLSPTKLEHCAELPAGWRSGEISFIPILPISGATSHLLISIRDTTAAKAVEAARHKEAQRKDEFLAMLAHELRNPLAPIRTIAQLLIDSDWDGTRTREFGLILQRQSQHMTRMVDDLLDLAHITRGEIELRMERCALGEIIRDAIQMLEADIKAKQQALSVQWRAGVPMVHGDSSRLAQVFANLISNASKYSAAGGAIEIAIDQQGGEAVVRVKDQGVGIDSQMLPLIFDCFTQADRTLDRRESGLGIGLAIAKRLVTMHGGQIQARSAGLGKGSEFVVTLPLAAPQMQVQAPVHKTVVAREQGAVTPRARVLLADDNALAAKMLALVLKLEGFEVHVVHDGGAALAAIEIYNPQIVLLDIGMPEVDGYVVARTIKERYPERKIRMIAVTGYGTAADRELALQSGFDAHVTKPADARQLVKLMAQDFSGAVESRL